MIWPWHLLDIPNPITHTHTDKLGFFFFLKLTYVHDFTSLKTTFLWCTMYFTCCFFKSFTYILVLFSYVIVLFHIMHLLIHLFLNNFGLGIFTLIPQYLQQVIFKSRAILYLVACRWRLIRSHAKIYHEILKYAARRKLLYKTRRQYLYKKNVRGFY